MPRGVDGLRKLRTTVIRHFVATKKLSKEPGVELLLTKEYARKNKNPFTQRRKARKGKEIKIGLNRFQSFFEQLFLVQIRVIAAVIEQFRVRAFRD
jgi:hypothetical protein